MVERCTEFIQLLLSDALAVSGQNLVLNLVDCSRRNKIRNEKSISIKDKYISAGSRPLSPVQF